MAFSTFPIQEAEISHAKRLSLIWTEDLPYFKTQEQLSEAQLNKAAAKILG